MHVLWVVYYPQITQEVEIGVNVLSSFFFLILFIRVYTKHPTQAEKMKSHYMIHLQIPPTHRLFTDMMYRVSTVDRQYIFIFMKLKV